METNKSPTSIDRQLLPAELARQFKDINWGAERLRSIAIFRCFNQDELKLLYQNGQVKSFRTGSHLVIEGEPTRGLYVLLVGTASVYKTDETTKAMYRLAFLEEGSNFGEMSLFDNAPRSATVSAETACHLFYLDIVNFENFLGQIADDSKVRFYKSCAEELAERFRRLNNDYVYAQKLLWQHALRKPEGDGTSPSQTSKE